MPPHAGAAMTLPPISIEELRKKDEVINFPVTGPECQTHAQVLGVQIVFEDSFAEPVRTFALFSGR